MPDKYSLQTYKEKRNFTHTPEPSDDTSAQPHDEEPIFVIQKHDATRLHYDFRLEVDGVLKSWAIPKGPSTNPRDKRLAMPTEDHPMGYANFEGVIPKGQYGAGPVIVWDTGTYQNATEKNDEPIPIEQALEEGQFKFRLNGKKLKGGFALIRMKKSSDQAWLLIKENDGYADPEHDVVNEEPESVISGRTIEDLAIE